MPPVQTRVQGPGGVERSHGPKWPTVSICGRSLPIMAAVPNCWSRQNIDCQRTIQINWDLCVQNSPRRCPHRSPRLASSSKWTTAALSAREMERNARPPRRELREPTCHSPMSTSCSPASHHDRNLHLLLRILPSLSPADAKLFKMRILEHRSNVRDAKLLPMSRAPFSRA
jgi:hypothetical protein